MIAAQQYIRADDIKIRVADVDAAAPRITGPGFARTAWSRQQISNAEGDSGAKQVELDRSRKRISSDHARVAAAGRTGYARAGTSLSPSLRP